MDIEEPSWTMPWMESLDPNREMDEEVFGQTETADTDLIDRNLKNFIPLKQLSNITGGDPR